MKHKADISPWLGQRRVKSQAATERSLILISTLLLIWFEPLAS